MAVTSLTRNLRDGELLLRDGSSPPNTLTVLLDEGDLSWTERTRTLEIKDRGSIAAGHLRRGDQESIAVSFTAKWTQLLGRSASTGDPLQLYEFLTFADGLDTVSTSRSGEQQTLELVFRVVDPAGVASEQIVFHKVYRETLTLSEGDHYNTISFAGRDFEPAVGISRWIPA